MSTPSAAPPGSAVGIDGCRGGWVWCEHRAGLWHGGLCETLEALTARLAAAELALIDMPIGLPDGGAGERACDREARALLGRPRASSVFRAPCRQALAAAPSGYACACDINRQRTGVALSLQTFNLLPKVDELDRLLQRWPPLRGRLRESHPELCLYGLNGRRPMRHNKRTAPGRRERLALLQRHDPGLEPAMHTLLARQPRRHLAADDVIDAAALALTARRLCAGEPLQRLPAQAPTDVQGLAMEMLFVVA